MADQIKYWWDKDGDWFCILTDDGIGKTTVSLTPEQATALADAVYKNGSLGRSAPEMSKHLNQTAPG